MRLGSLRDVSRLSSTSLTRVTSMRNAGCACGRGGERSISHASLHTLFLRTLSLAHGAHGAAAHGAAAHGAAALCLFLEPFLPLLLLLILESGGSLLLLLLPRALGVLIGHLIHLVYARIRRRRHLRLALRRKLPRLDAFSHARLRLLIVSKGRLDHRGRVVHETSGAREQLPRARPLVRVHLLGLHELSVLGAVGRPILAGATPEVLAADAVVLGLRRLVLEARHRRPLRAHRCSLRRQTLARDHRSTAVPHRARCCSKALRPPPE